MIARRPAEHGHRHARPGAGDGRLPRPRPRPALGRVRRRDSRTRRPRSPGWSAALHDDDGRVQVPGFYDDVLELTADERDAVRPGALRRRPSSSTSPSRGRWPARPASARLERIGARPTAEVNGIWGGYMGPGGKTIVPSDAHVKLSFRLVAAQQPGRDPGRGRRVRRRPHPGRHRGDDRPGRATASSPAWCRSTRPPTAR